MFKYLKSLVQPDTDLPRRAYDLDALKRVLDGTIYDRLKYPFFQERQDGASGDYIKLMERRPSVRYNLCKVVVDDSVSMLFSESHFPTVDSENEELETALNRIAKEVVLNETMIDVASRGSIGSAALWLRVLKGRIFVSALNTIYLTPTWKATAPDQLEKVTEKYKVRGSDLIEAGYAGIDDANTSYWFMREWTEQEEIHYLPWKVLDKDVTPAVDTSRSVNHKLGFVPMIWIRNLPGGDEIDGAPTFPPEAIDSQIEIDYQLSQAGRGLRYSSDPTLLIKEPAMGPNGEMVRGGGNAILVAENGDAKMLEINGTAVSAVIEYVKAVRELALENAHGNKVDAQKLSAATSGRAMELMNQALIWLADRLRISYGEKGLKSLYLMIIEVSHKLPLTYKDGSKIGELEREEITLRWPDWYAPTADDNQAEAITLQTLTEAGVISTETAVKSIADNYDIEDTDAELARIKSDGAEKADLAGRAKAVKQTVFRNKEGLLDSSEEK